MENEFCGCKKEKKLTRRTVTLVVAGKTKQRKPEKTGKKSNKKEVKKSKESKELREGSPTNTFLVGNYGLRRAESCRPCPPKWTRAKYH